MNTTKAGDELEVKVYDLLQSEIDAGRFFAAREYCKVYRKKGYFSATRGSDIIFDVSVEVSLAGATRPSLIVLIECKNYSSSVPVNDIEEFESKIRQVEAHKGIVAATSEFQSGTLAVARSKNMGLLRYFSEAEFKWYLHRSVAMFHVDPLNLSPSQILTGLVSASYRSLCHSVHFSLEEMYGTSISSLFERIFVQQLGSAESVRAIAPPRQTDPWKVEYVPSQEIEATVERALARVQYDGGEVQLEAICAEEHRVAGLKLVRLPSLSENGWLPGVLGRLQFEPLQITVFESLESEPGRERFTLAHELGHHFLGHSAYMRGEYAEASDFDFDVGLASTTDNLRRLEWQANHFASCLLLPAKFFVKDFLTLAEIHGLRNRGHGLLYVDDQQCNLSTYYDVTTRLMGRYKVSRSVIKFRLDRFGFLNDVRGTVKRLTQA